MKEKRSICEIATEIREKWDRPYYGAVPYLNAMDSLMTTHDKYGLESGEGIVLYFLANAGTFRGPDARRLKAELKSHLSS